MNIKKTRWWTARGSVATTFALTLPIMMGFVSMGVDWGEISVASIAVRAAADEAALVGASTLSDSPSTTIEIETAYALASERAEQYASAMALNGLTFELQELTFGYYDDETNSFVETIPEGESPNAVEAVVSTVIDMSFARLFGLSNVTISKTSRAGASIIPGRAPDLVIVQDVTPSMSSTDIANSKIANQALVDCIETRAHPSTRGALVKFGNIDKTVVPLQSYEDAPNVLYNAVAGTSPTSAYSNSGICAGGGCTSHSAGMYAAVDILNSASEPPDDLGQVIIFITDGAPYTNDSGCSSVASSSGMATHYQNWLVGSSTSRCGKLSAQTTSTNCNNVGGRWVSSYSTNKCRSSDNGAEGASSQGPGKCSLGTSYTSEARCEGNGGVWRRTSGTTANPSTHTQWTDETKALALAGTWGPIDVYGVYYSNGASTSYKNDNLWFITNHILTGKGAELGVLDAPSGTTLTEALKDLCKTYTVGRPGLIP